MDRPMLLTPAVVREGRLYLPHRPSFEEAVALWPDCRGVLRLEQARKPRSVALNAYYWGVCVHHVSLETGYTEREAHDLLKELHLSRRLHGMRGGAICFRCARVLDGTTTEMSGDEEWQFISRCHEWASTTLDLVIPDPSQSDLVAA